MLLSNLLTLLDEIAPLKYAEEWDCPGIALGERCAQLNRIGFALEASIGTVRQAISEGCDCLVVHHPPLFHATHHIVDEDGPRSSLILGARHNLSVVAWHTAWDCAEQGSNYHLLNPLGCKNVCPLLPKDDDPACGMGRIGVLEKPLTPQEVGSVLAEVHRWSGFRFWGIKPLRTVACGCGAAGEFWQIAHEQGAELYISSEFKRHQIAEGIRRGMSFIEIDHADSEEPSMEWMGELVAVRGRIETRFIRGPKEEISSWVSA